MTRLYGLSLSKTITGQAAGELISPTRQHHFPPGQRPHVQTAELTLHHVARIKFISIKGRRGFLSAPIVIRGRSHLHEC